MTHPDYLTSTSKHIPRSLSPVDGINSYSLKVQVDIWMDGYLW